MVIVDRLEVAAEDDSKYKYCIIPARCFIRVGIFLKNKHEIQ